MTRYPLVRRDLVSAVVAASLTAVAGLVYLIGTDYEWDGVWTQTGQYLRSGLLLAGPVAAATGAWLGAAERRNGLLDVADSAPRTVTSRNLAAVVVSVASVVVGYAVVIVYASGRTAANASFGHFPVGFAAVAVASMAGLNLLGFAFGSRFAWRLVPLTMVVGAYVVMAFLNSSATFGNLQPVDTRDVTHAVLPPALTWSWIGWFLALGASAVLLVWRLRLVTAVAASASVFCAIVLLSQPAFPYRHDAAASRLRCTRSGGVTVCMTQVHDYLASRLRELADVSRGPLAGTGLAPDVYRESVASPDERHGATVVFDPTNGRLVGSATVASKPQLNELATITFSALGCSDADQPGSSAAYHVTASDVVESWYRRRLHLPSYTVVDPENHAQVAAFAARTKHFAGLPDATRTRWLAAHARSLLTCQVPVAHLP